MGSDSRGGLLDTVLGFFGLLAAALAWTVIAASVATNPWFVFTSDAFSDLGGPRSTDPWLYNYGLVSVAALVFVYSIQLGRVAQSKVEVVAASFVMVASIFLGMIGVYHEGTYPHVFVSTWFFVQFDLAVLASGIGLYLRGKRTMGLAVLALFVVASLGAVVVRWPSAATIEAWGIGAIDVWAIIVFFAYRVHTHGVNTSPSEP
jgi:hypothetical membrane protein